MTMQLGDRGQRLWDAYADHIEGQRWLVLLEEACRIADRLDRLDALLVGDIDTWVELVEARGKPDVLEVRMDSALVEARQQAAVLRQLILSLPLRESGDADDADSWLDAVPAAVQHS